MYFVYNSAVFRLLLSYHTRHLFVMYLLIISLLIIRSLSSFVFLYFSISPLIVFGSTCSSLSPSFNRKLKLFFKTCNIEKEYLLTICYSRVLSPFFREHVNVVVPEFLTQNQKQKAKRTLQLPVYKDFVLWFVDVRSSGIVKLRESAERRFRGSISEFCWI